MGSEEGSVRPRPCSWEGYRARDPQTWHVPSSMAAASKDAQPSRLREHSLCSFRVESSRVQHEGTGGQESASGWPHQVGEFRSAARFQSLSFLIC